MEIRAIIIAGSIVHLFMWLAVTVRVYDCPVRTKPMKLLLVIVALCIPFIGPIFVNYLMGVLVRKRGWFIDTSTLSDTDSSDCSNWPSDSNHSGSSESGGGGGD